jgi:hypothetical protein
MDREKPTDTPTDTTVAHGIRVVSRHSESHELNVMTRIVDAIPAEWRQHVSQIFCDSKAGGVFSLDCSAPNRVCELILDNGGETLRRFNGGHNGLYINGREPYRDPEWDDYDPTEISCEHARLSPPRARTIVNGATQYRRQCLDCGEPVGTAIAKTLATRENRGDILQFDEALFA